MNTTPTSRSSSPTTKPTHKDTKMNIQDIENLSVYELARIADCLDPDNFTSPGAKFLGDVRDNLVIALKDANGEELEEDVIMEICDSAPDIYTHQKWQEFVDLGAYQLAMGSGDVDLQDYMGASFDMDGMASVALYIIAERLINNLINEMDN